MAYDFSSFSFRGCGCGYLPGAETAISAPVGQGGANRVHDTVTIQTLLNDVPTDQGGPRVPLAEDGIVGPLTIAAIRQFQTGQLGWVDGRVDPGGPTLARLRDYSVEGDAVSTSGLDAPGGGQHRSAPSPQMFEVIRRSTAIGVLPQARNALKKAQLDLDLVMLRLVKDTQHIEDLFRYAGPEMRPWRIFDRHFAIGKLSTSVAKKSLNFVRQTLMNMRAVLDGRAGIWGANIVEIDPVTVFVKELDQALAYTPNTTGNRARQTRLGISPFRIYFTNLIDGQSFDRYLYAVLHELAHFVDDETKLIIDDHAYGWQSYQILPHHQRIRNAECYSACAFEMAFGNARLAAIYPLLRVIEIDPVVIR